MRRLELTEDLLTGVEDIDEHHRTLLELGNKVINPSAYKKDGTIFEDALKFLADYVIYHFAAEEYVMIESNFPNYEHHRQWHERFKQEVSDCVNRAQTEGISKDNTFFLLVLMTAIISAARPETSRSSPVPKIASIIISQ